MRRFLILLAAVLTTGVAMASPAVACGGLVAPNGAVRLGHTSTLAAYHDGIEHYVTSFEYAGAKGEFGSIIPLPGVPTDVRRAGSWTLQRLERETHPPASSPFGAKSSLTVAAGSVQVLLQTKVDALDITVISGGGAAVLDWVKGHGYAVSADAPAMIDFYAHRSPVFLAARYDATAARARGQRVGDGTPVLITIPTPAPWVPLRILSLAKAPADPVQADVYLLTDRSPSLLGLSGGVAVKASEPASTSLLSDLRSDRDSGWVPDSAWLTFVGIDTTARQLTHDLAIDASGALSPSVVQAGYDSLGPLPSPQAAGVRPISTNASVGHNRLVAAVVFVALAVVLARALALAGATPRRRNDVG